MRQLKVPAVFMRGGTSNAIVFKAGDLPADRDLWPEVFLAAMGSPDPYGRQLNGMGGGISSLSKVCVVAPSARDDADIDYTFAQIGVRNTNVGFASNCGNMSSAMGPFAVDEGLVEPHGSPVTVRIYNTNTNKIIVARFELDDGAAAVDGDYLMPGVADPGGRVQLDFLDPGGAITGRLLPTGNVVDRIDVPGLGPVEASIVDAANPTVYVEAGALGLEGTEMPADLDANTEAMAWLESLRRRAGVLAGLAADEQEMAGLPTAMSPGLVASPRDAVILTGETIPAADGDLVARIVSSGNVHRALPATRTICTAVASRIEGTVVHRLARPGADPDADVRLVHPSGVTVLAARLRRDGGQWHAEYGRIYRTQRRLFEGLVCVPAAKVPGLAKGAEEAASAAE